jgi:hypothetical protein
MNIAELKESKYLTQKDFDTVGTIVTIKEVTIESVGQDTAAEDKWVMWFEELDKGLVVNITNAETVAAITGSEDSENWPGYQVVIYQDPNIRYGGKRVGGVRLRELSEAEQAHAGSHRRAAQAQPRGNAPSARRPAHQRLAPQTEGDDGEGTDLAPAKSAAPARAAAPAIGAGSPRRAQARGYSATGSNVEEEDNVAEEKSDPAPASGEAPDGGDAPPPVRAKGPRQEELKSRLMRLNTK